MRLVIVESPFSGDVQANIAYARRCVRDSVLRGEAPIASHLLFTQDGVLDDTKPEERKLGMEAGWAWMQSADLVAVYDDRGISEGMKHGIALAEDWRVAIVYRSIGV